MLNLKLEYNFNHINIDKIGEALREFEKQLMKTEDNELELVNFQICPKR